MTRKIRINGQEHDFTFDIVDDRAVNGRFNGAEDNIIKDLIAEYGKTAVLHEIVQQICEDIQLYSVVVRETIITDFVYETYAMSTDDARDEIMAGNGKLVDTDELCTDSEIVDCKLVEYVL
jgi:hypothetical protein